MPIRSVALAVFLATMTFACEQKMAPVDDPSASEDATTAPDAGDTTADKPATDAKNDDAKNDEAKNDGAPAPSSATTPGGTTAPPKTDDAKTTTPAPTDDAKNDDAKNDDASPKDFAECMAQCKDPGCFTDCVTNFNPDDSLFPF